MYQITPNNTFNMYRKRMPIDTSNSFNVMDSFQPRLSSIIAIGNPIVDILAEIEKEIVQRFKLVWGGAFFANESNMGFFDELESRPQVTYTPFPPSVTMNNLSFGTSFSCAFAIVVRGSAF